MKTKNWLAGAALAVLVGAGLAVAVGSPAGATVTIPEGYVLIGDHCKDWSEYVEADKVDTTGDPATVDYTAPEGQYVKAYCVKAGTEAYEYTTTGMPTSVTIDHPVKDSISHYQVVLGTLPKPDPEPPVDYCDPTQKPGGMSIAKWLSDNDVDPATCFTVEVVNTCGSLDINVTGPEGIAWGAQWLEDPATPVWPGSNFPAVFDEDYNGGSVTVNYWLVGGESDYLKGSSLPNLWDGTYESVVVDTDCERPTQPEPEYRTDTDEESYCSADGIRTIKTSGQDLIREYVWGDDAWVLGEWEPVNSWALISEETVADETCLTPEPEPEPEPRLSETGPEQTAWIGAGAILSLVMGGVSLALRRMNA